MRSFLSPYGDGTMKIAYCAVCKKFSPPYGDKSKSALQGLDRQQMTFPSPCGEKLKSMLLTPTTWTSSFRPLAGMVPLHCLSISTALCFRPLTGMILPWTPWSSQFRSFRPLTGIVQTGSFTGSAHCSFRPLTSPPYGDGTFRPTFDPNRR